MKSFLEFQRIDEVNHREHAQAGKVHPSMAKHMSVGQEHDFYHSKTGDKISGVVKHKTDKEVHLQANKDGKVGGGETHKFSISEETAPWETDAEAKKRKESSFKKPNNPNRTGMDSARALAQRGLAAAKAKKMKEEVEIEEQAPVAPTIDRKYIKGTPEHKAHKEKSKPINGHPTNKMKEETEIEEALVGGQKNLDKNKNGKLDKKDFELLRKEESEQVEEGAFKGTAEVIKQAVKVPYRAVKRVVGGVLDTAKDVGDAAKNIKKKFKEDEEYDDATLDAMIFEVLSKDASAGDWIHDFVHSDNPKFEGKSKEKRKQMALAAYYSKQNEEVELDESYAKVETKKYSWGTMKTAHHGASFSVPMHPEHHKAIAGLKDQQEHKFKTEDGRHWTAKRQGDDVHLHSANDGPKTKIKHSDMKEGWDQKKKKSLKEFVQGILEYESDKNGRYVHTKGSYGKSYNSETDDHDDDNKPKSTEKRGRGRPAGSKSGARQQNTGKSYGGIATHSLNLPNTNK